MCPSQTISAWGWRSFFSTATSVHSRWVRHAMRRLRCERSAASFLRRYHQKVWKKEEGGVSAWVNKRTGRRPGSAERRHRHEAADHNTASVVRPDVAAIGSVCARAGSAVHPSSLGGGDHGGMRTVEIGPSGLRGDPYGQFPREHWRHLRTTNVMEFPFAAVRLRTTAAKRFKRADAATAMSWKVLQGAENRHSAPPS